MRILLSISLILFLGGCLKSVPPVNKTEMSKVKRVAVIAYTMDYYTDLKSGLMGALMGGEKKMGMSKIENKLEEKPISKGSYVTILKHLKKMGWQVASPKKTVSSPTLSAFYRKPVKTGFLPLQDRNVRLEKKGVPQYHYAHSLKGTGKYGKIAKELGVDALVFVYVDTKMTNAFMGLATYKFNSVIKMEMINPRTEEKIMNLVVTGDEVEEVKKAQWIKDDLHQDNSFRSVKVAAKQLTDKMKEQLK